MTLFDRKLTVLVYYMPPISLAGQKSLSEQSQRLPPCQEMCCSVEIRHPPPQKIRTFVLFHVEFLLQWGQIA